MSETIELTEEQVEEMYNILLLIQSNISDEQDILSDSIELLGNVGEGNIDKRLHDLIRQKEKNLQLQSETILVYIELWKKIVEKYTEVECSIADEFLYGKMECEI